MAVTTQNSTQYGNMVATPPVKQDAHVMLGKVRIAYFEHTQSGAGEATSSAAIVKLPPGKVRVLGPDSHAYVNWTTASATLDLGWDAYTNINGVTVVADPNGLDDGIDVELAGFQTFGSAVVASGGTKVFESQDGVVLRVTSQDVALASASTIAGYICYVIE
jgi:hypothetical protein